MTRKFSSTSVATTLASGINSSTTTIVVATGTSTALMGGVTLGAGNVDSFALALDADTLNEEIVWVTQRSSDTLTVIRAEAGTTAIAHTAGATVKHVLTGDDATFFTAGVATANTAVPESVVTAKGDVLVASASGVVDNLAVGTNDQYLIADSTTALGVKWGALSSTVTLTGTQTLTNKTLTAPTITSPTVSDGVFTSPILKSPEERTTVSATAATGTINLDTVTQGTLYYTTAATANWTLNVRGNSGTTLSSLLAVGDSITVAFLATQGATAFYQSAFQIDGVSVTPKWQNATAPTAGNVSGIDAYLFTIIKTAATPTYTVFASQTRFA
jgi:hypothetical protein